jgi:hypothetical protein
MSEWRWSRIYAGLQLHRLRDLELTPLVEARIAARERSYRIEAAGFIALIAVFFAVGLWEAITGHTVSTAGTIGQFIAAYLVLHAATAVALRLQRRTEGRLAEGLSQRVSRSVAVRLPDLVGRQLLWSAAVVYGGGLVVGATMAGISKTVADRVLAGTFTLGVALFGALSLWLLTDVVRRPAIADDERSLRADDRLRTVDADRAVAPYPLLLAAVAMVGSRGSVLRWVFLGYLVGACLLMIAPRLPRVWGVLRRWAHP